jgi:hypothetical protein
VTVGQSTPVSGGVAGMIAAPARSLTKVFAAIGVLAVAIIIAAFVMKPGSTLRAQREARMQAQRDSVKLVTDSLARVAQAASLPTVLSKDDSMKIAENVNRQMRQQRIRDSARAAKVRDSIQRVEERKTRDSIFKAFGGTRNAPAKRRIVVLEPLPSSRWPEAEQIGRAVADSLRSMLAKRAFIIVSPDSIRAIRGQSRTAQPAEWGSMFNSELLVAIRIDERPPRRGQTGPDSVMLRINAYDLTASPRYYSRSIPPGSQWSVHEELLSSLDATLLQTIGALEEMTRAPRRSASDSSRGPTTTVTLPDGRSITVPSVGFPPGAFTEIQRMNEGRGRAARDSAAAAAKSPTQPTAPKKPPV